MKLNLLQPELIGPQFNSTQIDAPLKKIDIVLVFSSVEYLFFSCKTIEFRSRTPSDICLSVCDTFGHHCTTAVRYRRTVRNPSVSFGNVSLEKALRSL